MHLRSFDSSYLREKFNKIRNTALLIEKVAHVGYIIDYFAGEKAGCSAQINIADRIFYTKNFAGSQSRFFSADQRGVIEKEISKNEFEFWVGALADSETDVPVILKKLAEGKKY